MKSTVIIGIILIALGLVALVYKGVSYTTKEKVVDLGPIEATADKTKTIPFSPIFGVVALAGGITLVVVGNKKV